MRRLADWIDRGVGSCVDAGKWLALPVVLLLSAQWPLRDLVRCCSREANDLGQWLFALFIAVASNSVLTASRFALPIVARLSRTVRFWVEGVAMRPPVWGSS